MISESCRIDLQFAEQTTIFGNFFGFFENFRLYAELVGASAVTGIPSVACISGYGVSVVAGVFFAVGIPYVSGVNAVCWHPDC